jgi:hypothetical protein
VPAYDPQKSFNRIKRAGSLPWDAVAAGLDALGSPGVAHRPATTAEPRPAIEADQPVAPTQAGAQVMR